MKQEQEGGEGSTNNQAGRDLVIHQGMSAHQMGELVEYIDHKVMAVFTANFAKLTDDAGEIALDRAHQFLLKFIEELASKNPEHIGSIQTVAMQDAILKAQTTAAIVDDEDLNRTLVDVLVEKAGTEPGSFKGVVLAEALEVARKLTADQINLLTAIVMITQTVSYRWSDYRTVFDHLNEQCKPLYGKIPTSGSTIAYMTYTGVGRIENIAAAFGVPATMAGKIIDTYAPVFTKGFPISSIPDELRSEEKFPGLFVPVPEEFESLTAHQRVNLATVDLLSEEYIPADSAILYHKEQLQELMTKNPLDKSAFERLLTSRTPQLAEFLHQLDNISAAAFLPSTVGTALGHANWRRVHPASAPSVDIYLN